MSIFPLQFNTESYIHAARCTHSNCTCRNSTTGPEIIFTLRVYVHIHMDKSDSLRALVQTHVITHLGNPIPGSVQGHVGWGPGQAG